MDVHRQLQQKKSHRKSSNPLKNRSANKTSIICDEYWTEIKTCCGIIYEHKLIKAALIDSQMYNICARHNVISESKRDLIKCLPIIKTKKLIDPYIERKNCTVVHHTLKSNLSAQTIQRVELNIANTHLKNDVTNNNKHLVNVHLINEKFMEAFGHKFNDNSSDSGYEEILQEPNNVIKLR